MNIKDDGMDRYDFLLGATMGIFSGLLDVFFVGKPGDSILGNWTDKTTNSLVMKFAKMKGCSVNEDSPNALQNAVQFLEREYKVNYDQGKSIDTNYAVGHMTPKNHHLKSLGHNPDLIGLCFSIMDQFQQKSSFLDNGQLIRIDTANFELEGSNFISKVYAGAGNWFGHLMSDVAGSSGAIGNGNRGSGIPIPFYEMFGLCNFGEFGQYRQPLSTIMVQVFEKGYDLRHGAAMAIPPVVGDLLTMMGWSLKRRFYHDWEWKACIPSDKYKSYRRIKLVNKGAFCLVDGADAYIRGKGNPIEVVLRMNLIAWLKLVKLIIKELMLSYGRSYEDVYNDMVKVGVLLDEELVKLKSYDYAAWQMENEQMKDFNKQLEGASDLKIGQLAGEYIFASEVKLNYSDFDEFDKLFSNNQKLF